MLLGTMGLAPWSLLEVQCANSTRSHKSFYWGELKPSFFDKWFETKEQGF